MKSGLKIIGYFLNMMGYLIPITAGRWAAKIFCFPMRPKLKPKHKEFLNLARWKTVRFKEEKIAFYKWGNGSKKILMLHGWQSHSYRWKRYVAQFDLSEYTIVAFDAPGHGMSSGRFFNVPEYGELLIEAFKDLEKVEILIGHSIGGFAALYGVSSLNLIPKKLIVLASPGDAMDFMSVYRNMFGFNQTIEDNIQAYMRSLYKVDLTDFKATEFSERLNVPGLIIHDEYDPDCDVEYAKAVHAKWRDSELILTKGKGHHLVDDQSIEEVVNFVKSELEPRANEIEVRSLQQ